VLKTIQVIEDPSDVGSAGIGCTTVVFLLERRVDALLELDADRVVETSQFSLGVLEAPGELWVLSEPLPTEAGIGVELCDAVSGCGDSAIELRHDWPPVGVPVPPGLSLGPCS
jgi:hypothetical protein